MFFFSSHMFFFLPLLDHQTRQRDIEESILQKHSEITVEDRRECVIGPGHNKITVTNIRSGWSGREGVTTNDFRLLYSYVTRHVRDILCAGTD